MIIVLRFLQLQVAERNPSQNDISKKKRMGYLQVESLKSIGMNSGPAGSSECGLALACFPLGWLHSQSGCHQLVSPGGERQPLLALDF